MPKAVKAMSGIIVATWEALGFAKVGRTDDAETKPKADLLQETGHTLQVDTDFTWAKLDFVGPIYSLGCRTLRN